MKTKWEQEGLSYDEWERRRGRAWALIEAKLERRAKAIGRQLHKGRLTPERAKWEWTAPEAAILARHQEQARKVALLVTDMLVLGSKLATHTPVALACRAAAVENWAVPANAEACLMLEVRALGVSRAVLKALEQPAENNAWVDVVLRAKRDDPNLSLAAAAKLAGISRRTIRRHPALSKAWPEREKTGRRKTHSLNTQRDSET